MAVQTLFQLSSCPSKSAVKLTAYKYDVRIGSSLGILKFTVLSALLLHDWIRVPPENKKETLQVKYDCSGY
jgi:hypothetical protein